MPLEDYENQLYYSCIGCGSCRVGYKSFMPICPSGEKFGFDSYYAVGRLKIARGLLDGTVEWSEALLDRFFTCTGCAACNELCYPQTGMKPLDIIMEVKRQLVERGIAHPRSKGVAHTRHKEIVKNFKRYHNPYGRPSRTQTEECNQSGAEILYFVGCQRTWEAPQIVANETIKLLRLAQVDFCMLPDEWCCGSPVLATGHQKAAREIFKHNIEAIEKLGVKTVVFDCPTCYITFRDSYPTVLGKELPFKLIHRIEYLEGLINSQKLRPVKEVTEKVTYHDPCTLGRLGKIYESPRNVLNSVPGLEIVEMPRNRESAWCCGSGGGVAFSYPDFATWTALRRLDEAESTGANLLTTVCPICEKAFVSALGAEKRDIEVCDVSELLLRSLE
jgi:heterodisulfide reductase subunit D